jgi:hypothetical protein
MTIKKVILRAVSDLSCVFFFMSCSGQTSTPLAVVEDRKKLLVSIRSNAGKGYYSNLQKALLSGRLMSIDKGSSDTPLTQHTWCAILKALAFFDEYPNSNGFQRGNTN